jgi:hypothetical protein
METEQSTFIVSSSQTANNFSRWTAASLHLAISIAVALAVVAAMLFIWYPAPYFQALGGSGLLMLIVGVDVVLGPLITFIVFDTRKKSLEFDLICVVVVQIAALAYGVSTMFQARPVYTVFTSDRFDVIIAADMSDKERAKVVNAEFKSLSITGPQIVAMETPRDMNEIKRMLDSGIESRAFSQYYVPYESKAKSAGAASQSLSQKQKTSPQSAEKLRAFFAEKKIDENKVGVLPLYTRSQDMTVVLERDTGKVLAIAPVAP